MSRYDAVDDPLCYPGTQVLKNKAGLTDQGELDQFEQLMFLTRSEEPLPDGNLDYEHYKAIHKHFFQDAIGPSMMLSPTIQGTTIPMTDRAARRFCDRLVELGVARELTGRSSFRLYGIVR